MIAVDVRAGAGEQPAAAEYAATAAEGDTPELARTVEALLFLSADPLSVAELAEACEAGEGAVAGGAGAARRGVRARAPRDRAARARRRLHAGQRPRDEEAARRLFSRPRLATLTPAQAETLAIVAYLQPISRPEIARIRGVSADSATATLLERGLIEEAGHSQFGAVQYRTTHAVPEAVRPARPRGAARRRALGPEPRGAGRAARPAASRRRGARRRRRGLMLTYAAAFSGFSVDDIVAARDFYSETLSIEVEELEDDGLLRLHLAGGSEAIVYPKPDHVPAVFTILNFVVRRHRGGRRPARRRGRRADPLRGLRAGRARHRAQSRRAADRVVQRSRREHPRDPGVAGPALHAGPVEG